MLQGGTAVECDSASVCLRCAIRQGIRMQQNDLQVSEVENSEEITETLSDAERRCATSAVCRELAMNTSGGRPF